MIYNSVNYSKFIKPKFGFTEFVSVVLTNKNWLISNRRLGKHTPNETKVGDETPEDTTQSYAEDNVVVNPHEVTDKRSLIENQEELEKGYSRENLLPNSNYGFVNRRDSEEINRHEDKIGTIKNSSQTISEE